MQVRNVGLSLAALFAAAAPSAQAADWGSGGREIVPVPAIAVPAPVPIPEYAPSWYFRLDAGIGTISSPSVSESGYRYGGLISGGVYSAPGSTVGGNGYPGAVLQNLDPTWFSSDFSNLSTFGAGVGYYLGGGWRMDATVEKRSNDQADISGEETWDSYRYVDTDGNPATAPVYLADWPVNGIVDRRTTINVSDRVDVDGTVWMANLYYDLATRRGFTPYIGAGIGFVWNQLDRTHSTSVTSCDNEASPGCTGGTEVYSATATNSADTISLAAAAMVGFSYQVSDITSVDVGYRYLFLGGTDFATTIDGAESRISIGDQHVHQLRAGLRFDVN